jgi:hypothetical protein
VTDGEPLYPSTAQKCPASFISIKYVYLKISFLIFSVQLERLLKILSDVIDVLPSFVCHDLHGRHHADGGHQPTASHGGGDGQ